MFFRHIKISILALGITSIVTQIILLREFLNVFYGNELVMGIVLANWMLLNATGAYLGKFINRNVSHLENVKHLIIILQLLVSFIPFLTVFSIYYLRNNIFPVGTMISLSSSFISSFLLLTPYCLISGFMFTLYCQLLSGTNNTIPKVYSLDVIGSIIGGLIFNLILIFYLNTFQILIVLVLINLLTSILLSISSTKKVLNVISCVLCLVSCVCFSKYDFEQIAKDRLYKGQIIAVQKDSPYGNIVITKTAEQLNFFENGVFLCSNKNLIQKEEDVHYAMLQHNAPRQVLLISGGLSGTIDELLKYNINRVDYVEINPWIINSAQSLQGFKNLRLLHDPRVNIVNRDAILFLNTKHSSPNSLLPSPHFLLPAPYSLLPSPHFVLPTPYSLLPTYYDVVLIDVPPPSTAQLNRFYTLEFLTSLKKHLNDSAVISLSLMSTADYVTKEAGELNFVLYNTLKKVFKNVLIVPGEKNYFLASDKSLNINIAYLFSKQSAVDSRLLSNKYVNQYYIDDELLRQRSDFILNSISQKISKSDKSDMSDNLIINRDFSPVAYYLQLQYWLSYFSKKNDTTKVFKTFVVFVFSIICLLFCIFYFSRLKTFDTRFTTIYISLFTTGFTASSVQFLLLIYFQVMYGYVYQMTGILITLFMLGLAAGTYITSLMSHISSLWSYSGLIFALAIYTIAIPFILLFLKHFNANSTIIQIVFFLITIDIGTITGIIFTYAVSLQKSSVSSIAAKSYSSDLLGSAIAAFLVSAFLLPLLGLIKVSIFIGILNILSGIMLLIKNSKVKT